ncbi:hypothetical protein XELAEV_18038903mg [Xenopus laevis]|uniref:Uncharacterized protein n=1 Tax=Xenopus laevis TaxID=8355 RepID=A0A974C6I4_XENLA|nr:hypothetical protein XELAEV_18038903mg [Xenopus laevis]
MYTRAASSLGTGCCLYHSVLTFSSWVPQTGVRLYSSSSASSTVWMAVPEIANGSIESTILDAKSAVFLPCKVHSWIPVCTHWMEDVSKVLEESLADAGR